MTFSLEILHSEADLRDIVNESFSADAFSVLRLDRDVGAFGHIGSLCQNVFHDDATHVGQSKVAPGIVVGQAFVIQAQQVQDRGVQVVDVDWVFNGVPAEFVGGAVSHASSDAAASQPHRESERMMIATVLSLGSGRATEFTTPDHQRLVEQAARFQILKQTGDRLIGGEGIVLVSGFKTAVLVPGLKASRRMIELHKANAPLDEAPGQKTLAAEQQSASDWALLPWHKSEVTRFPTFLPQHA